MNPQREWLTPQEVGNLTGFSASQIRKEIGLKALPARLVMSRAGKLGRWRIHKDDALAYARQLGVYRDARTS
jgi:hypothetical protein